MMSPKDSADLTRVGPGTVMGEFMRQYWLPAAMSSELKADGDPMRLLLLGEKLLAFRDSSGRVGVLEHRCPHRCASLFLGRNEENGLRCVYHGWKFDTQGNCVDMPNTPASQAHPDRVKAKAYKTAERNGLVWVYMGRRETAPPLPAIEASLLPESEAQIWFAQRECNWLQALEGDIDTSHFGFLHVGSVQPEDVAPDNLLRYTVRNRAPAYHSADTAWGTMYGAYRAAESNQTYWRFANYLFPFWTQTPQGPFDRVGSRAWVPMDDTHTMFVSLNWKNMPRPAGQVNDSRVVRGSTPMPQMRPNSTDWLGRWRVAGNEGNDWMIDRGAQRSGAMYTGIMNIHSQDQAVTESMGPVTDHLHEHLGPSDEMISRTRRRVLRAARAWRDKHTVPPGVDNPDMYFEVRSGDFLADAKIAWRDAYARQVRGAIRPLQRAAE